MKAEAILAALMEITSPKAADLPRLATVAIAAEDVTREVFDKKGWPSSQDELSAAIVTGIINESWGREDIHSGALRGKAGEVCLMQIHPTNAFWAELTGGDFDALGGTDYESTRLCLTAGARTLRWGARRCLAQHYRTYWREAMWSAYHLGGACWASPHRFKRARMQSRIVSTSWQISPEVVDLISKARARRESEKGKADPPPAAPCPCECPKDPAPEAQSSWFVSPYLAP